MSDPMDGFGEESEPNPFDLDESESPTPPSPKGNKFLVPGVAVACAVAVIAAAVFFFTGGDDETKTVAADAPVSSSSAPSLPSELPDTEPSLDLADPGESAETLPEAPEAVEPAPGDPPAANQPTPDPRPEVKPKPRPTKQPEPKKPVQKKAAPPKKPKPSKAPPPKPKQDHAAPPPESVVKKDTSQQDLNEEVQVDSGIPSEPAQITMLDRAANKERTTGVVPTGHKDIGNGNVELTMPQDIGKMGWYASSAAPGEQNQGTIVMSGHVNYSGKTGYAAIILSMKKGDIITIKDKNGKLHKYRANSNPVDVSKKDHGAMAKAAFNRSDGPEQLVLVTCGGKYDPNSPLGYQSNFVVIADPVK